MKYIFLIIVTVGLSSCEFFENQGKEKKGSDNIVKQYRADGSLKNAVTLIDGKRHGVAKSYYPNGKVQQKIDYINNIKHGWAITYYETGGKYIETPYDSGEMHGIRKYYRPDGQLMAELPFYQGEPTAGLKEYLLDGKEKQGYPEIKIKVNDQILLKNRYTLTFSVTEASRKVEFYLGKLDQHGRIPNDALQLESAGPGKAELMFSVPPGSFVMEELNIIAKAQTRLGHPYITQRKHNVAVENRGY